MKTKMTIFAEALASNRDFKNGKIDGTTVGVANARVWKNAVKALLIPAYRIAAYRHDHMGDKGEVVPCDMADFFEKFRAILDLVGEVNGAKLFAENIADSIISASKRWRVIDITVEMADARCEMREARKAMRENENEETAKAYEDARLEVERLEGIAGNCKKLFENQGENPFVKEVELLLGDAINGQLAKSPEAILAEMEAKRKARREKTAAKRKANKKNA